MLRKTCLVLVLLLIAFPAMGIGSVFIDGGQAYTAISLPKVGIGLPIIIPVHLQNLFERLIAAGYGTSS